MITLPEPNLAQRHHSQQLLNHIAQHGTIPFDKFMALALYTPGLGYYHSGKTLFGADGDFITAPELSPLFGQCIIDSLRPILQAHPAILELGAGSGKLAASIMHDHPVEHYYILEPSVALQQLQQQTLQQHCPQYYARFTWLDTLPTQFAGAIIANEVMDALPACRFHWQGQQLQQYGVCYDGERLIWQLLPAVDPALIALVKQLNLPDDYTSEWQPWLVPWLASLADCLTKGALLLIDYGFPRHEYYHADRHQGTLMCHYRHHAHSDPLWYPGLQDITVHVDFTAVAEAASANHLEIAGYTSQAAFLLQNHITTKAQTLAERHAVKMLTLPQEMGELFKVMLCTRDWDKPLTGFERFDRRYQL